MKVILLGDVKTLGKRGAVVDVAEGYARNFLLPRSLATEASKGALAILDDQKKAQDKRDAHALAETKELAAQLSSKPVSVRAKAGGNGKLFGAVTNADIADAITQTFAVTVDKHKIEIKSAIKALGTYPVEIRLGKNIVAKTTVAVVAA
ncbi:MAG: 50S ribosomal protein L9 [Candidatus Eremiobacteraeota bacterium]|nr:50S ribosomal protein L9 [Candidatus Eremiobacteraeota bacterium]